MSIAHGLRQATKALAAAGVEDAAGDARRLLAHALGVAPYQVTLMRDEDVTDMAAELFSIYIGERLRRRPVSQIVGHRIFWGREFLVTRDVLDPRPETETLVVAAFEIPFKRVLDLGTGTGCILLSLLAERPRAHGLGVDISEAALKVARWNAKTLGLSERAEFAQGDWLQGLSGRYDLIVSNPPYIAAEEMANLAPEVREHEPHLALTDGADGLSAYRTISASASLHLTPGGRLLVEIGPTQGAEVARLFAQAGLSDVRILPDLDGRDRVVAGVSSG